MNRKAVNSKSFANVSNLNYYHVRQLGTNVKDVKIMQKEM